MKFSILVLGAPHSSQSPESALRFANAVLDQGHSIYRIFFYHDGVYCANALAQAPQDEAAIPQRWSELGQRHQLDLVVCIGSALKRGIIDAGEARRYEKPAANLLAGFSLSGLGQWVDACMCSNRIVSFGD